MRTHNCPVHEQPRECSTCEYSKPQYPQNLDYCINCTDVLQNWTPMKENKPQQ